MRVKSPRIETPLPLHRPPKAVLRTAGLAMLVVGVLSLGTLAVQMDLHHAGDNYARTINIAGHQRMLSQRIALLAQQLANDPADRGGVEPQLRQALDEMSAIHVLLRDGDPSGYYLTTPERAVRELMLDPETDLDQLVRDYVAGVRALIPGLLAERPAAARLLRRRTEQAVHVLQPMLDAMAAAIEQASLDAQRRIRRREEVVFGVTVAALAAMYLFMFRPLARQIRSDFNQLAMAFQKVEEAALTDPLTGLGNRQALMTALDQAGDRPLAVLQVDLDHFKTVNDLLGHATGDAVLVAVGAALRAAGGDGAMAFRLGGDEFVLVLLEDVSVERAAKVAERVITAIDRTSPRDALAAGLAASIGVAVHHPGEGERAHLLANADIALYEAKTLGRHRYAVFEPVMRAPIETRMSVEYAFRKGLLANELTLHLQPQVDLATGRVIGLEALARWQRDGGEVLGADRFIPYVETTPLILEVADRLMDQALSLQRRLRAAGLNAGPIGLNVAELQLRDPGFADAVLERLTAAGLGPDAICIEIVERAFVGRGTEQVHTQLARLAAAGIMIDLDDFGTGHASLTHLKALPIGRIKIDRSFVAGIGRAEGDETIVRATIEIAQSFGRRVIAEGVETAAQRAFLLRHGCREGQGYLFAPALPETALVRWLKARQDVALPVG